MFFSFRLEACDATVRALRSHGRLSISRNGDSRRLELTECDQRIMSEPQNITHVFAEKQHSDGKANQTYERPRRRF